MKVRNNREECVPFERKKVTDSLIKELGLKEFQARKISRSIKDRVDKIDTEEIIGTDEIRDMVYDQLVKRGMLDKAREYRTVGVPVYKLRQMIKQHDRDNANMARNPETIHKNVADQVMKPFALNCIPSELEKAHLQGDFHIHDLEYFAPRAINCLQHDLRFFIRNGLKVDGTGEHTSVAGPANNIETLVNHAGQVLMASQVNMSGGQSLPLLNVFMAPYVAGLPYERVKQAMQMFVFNLNMSYTSRGGQSVFSSVNMELDVPKFLESEVAWGPGGKQIGTYGDYSDETRILQKAFTEVLTDGDALGKPHLFPNPIYTMRKEFMGPEYDEDLMSIFEFTAKYFTPYFANMIPDWTGGHSDVMGCRTRLNANWTGDWDKDTLRTGNLAYVSLNLPRLSYKGDIYENLDHLLQLSEEILLIRREHALKLLNKHKLLHFLTQPDQDGSPYYRIENSTLSFGVVGLNEMLLAESIEGGLSSKEGQKEGITLLKYINEHVKELTEETRYRWTVLQTPGETTAHRFATLDKQHYKDKAITNGSKGSYYYTNSTHVNPADSMNLVERIKIEEKHHPLTAGGHIFHAFLGESHPNPEALASLTKKTLLNSNLGFMAYTGSFSYCFRCNNYMRGLQEVCPKCGLGDETEWFSRITGYYQAVGHKKDAMGGWNAGKQAELKDRYEYNVPS